MDDNSFTNFLINSTTAYAQTTAKDTTLRLRFAAKKETEKIATTNRLIKKNPDKKASKDEIALAVKAGESAKNTFEALKLVKSEFTPTDEQLFTEVERVEAEVNKLHPEETEAKNTSADKQSNETKDEKKPLIGNKSEVTNATQTRKAA